MRLNRLAIVFVAVMSVASFAIAKGQVTGDIQAFLVSVSEDGKETMSLVNETEPGQIMEFQIVFTNEGDADVTGIQVVDPVPEFTTFIGSSHGADVSADFEVSIDEGTTFEREPVVRIQTLADGSTKEVVIPASEYTHVRWVANEALTSNGGTHRFSYRVTVQ